LNALDQSDRRSHGCAEDLDLPVGPEPSRIERDDVTGMTAAGHFKHHASAHRTPHHVDVAEILLGDEVFHGIGEGRDGDLTGHRWALPKAGQVDGDHRAFTGQCGDDEVPIVQVGDAVDEQERLT